MAGASSIWDAYKDGSFFNMSMTIIHVIVPNHSSLQRLALSDKINIFIS